MKFKLLILALILFASCSKEQTSDENVLNSDSKEISLDDFKDVQEQSDDKRGRGNCLDNCFAPGFDFWSSTNAALAQVSFNWQYSPSIVLNPSACNTTVYLQIRAIEDQTFCGDDVAFYDEEFNVDITDEFLTGSPGQIVMNIVGPGADIENYELTYKLYEYRVIINASCGLFTCCQDTDWECFVL